MSPQEKQSSSPPEGSEQVMWCLFLRSSKILYTHKYGIFKTIHSSQMSAHIVALFAGERLRQMNAIADWKCIDCECEQVKESRRADKGTFTKNFPSKESIIIGKITFERRKKISIWCVFLCVSFLFPALYTFKNGNKWHATHVMFF